MERLEVNLDTLKSISEGSLGTVLDTQGTNGIVIKNGEELIKINRESFDRIVDEDHKYITYSNDYLSTEQEKLLKRFDALRSKIKLTEFPHKGIYFGDKLIGTVSKFYKGRTLDNAKPSDNIYRITIDVLNILFEYEKNGISFQDVHARNYIIDDNGIIHPIDLDDPKYTFIKNPNFYGMYHNYWNLLIPELLYETFSKIDFVNYGYTRLGILDALYDELPLEYQGEIRKLFFETEEYEKKKIK